MTEQHIIAVHESGHAVYGLLAGLEIRSVRLTAGNRPGVIGGICELDLDERDGDRFDLLIKQKLAGRAAERKLTGRDSSRSQADVVEARILIARYLQCPVDDPWVGDYFRVCESSLDALMGDARAWSWISTAATELQRKKQLTHREVHECKPRTLR